MLTLTKDELAELTGYAIRQFQAKVLTEQAIPFKEVNGRLVVLRAHVVAWMENRPIRQEQGINFGAVR